jgi:hypothetical protein
VTNRNNTASKSIIVCGNSGIVGVGVGFSEAVGEGDGDGVDCGTGDN